jgi:hypothetical protein
VKSPPTYRPTISVSTCTASQLSKWHQRWAHKYYRKCVVTQELTPSMTIYKGGGQVHKHYREPTVSVSTCTASQLLKQHQRWAHKHYCKCVVTQELTPSMTISKEGGQVHKHYHEHAVTGINSSIQGKRSHPQHTGQPSVK